MLRSCINSCLAWDIYRNILKEKQCQSIARAERDKTFWNILKFFIIYSTSLKCFLKKNLLLQEVSTVIHYPSDLILIHIQGQWSKTLVSIICCTADCIWIELCEATQIWFKSQAPLVSVGFIPVYKGLNFMLCVQLGSSSYSQWNQLGYHQGLWGRTLYSRQYFTHQKLQVFSNASRKTKPVATSPIFH